MKHGAKPEKSGDAKPPVLTIRKDSGAAMNTSKGVIMKSVISSIFSVVVTFLSMPSLAQTFGNGSGLADSSAMPQHSVTYNNAAVENQLAGTINVNQVQRLESGTGTTLKVKIFRVEGLSMTNSRSNMLLRNDHASFMVNAPMPTVNGALSLVGTIYQSPLDKSVTKLAQFLSLAATRKINAEFAYSAQINKYSRFDSVITCSLHPGTGSGNSSVAANFKYNVKF